jgi:hypothetical protein
VVLIHGIGAPAITWKDVVPALASKGFRILVYGMEKHLTTQTQHIISFLDVYGRGYSEAPKVPCDANLCTCQLALLLQYIGWGSTDVVGFSMVCAVFFVFGRLQLRYLINNRVVPSLPHSQRLFPILLVRTLSSLQLRDCWRWVSMNTSLTTAVYDRTG